MYFPFFTRKYQGQVILRCSSSATKDVFSVTDLIPGSTSQLVSGHKASAYVIINCMRLIYPLRDGSFILNLTFLLFQQIKLANSQLILAHTMTHYDNELSSPFVSWGDNSLVNAEVPKTFTFPDTLELLTIAVSHILLDVSCFL